MASVEASKRLDRATNYELLGPDKLNFVPPIWDRITAVQKIMLFSLRYSALGTAINSICHEQGHKLIIFELWPITMLITETSLDLLGIGYRSMHADHSAEVRGQMARELNDSKDKDKIFVISLKCVMVGLTQVVDGRG